MDGPEKVSGAEGTRNVPKEKPPKSTSVRIILSDERGRILLVLEKPHEVILPGSKVFIKSGGWGLPGGRLKRRADGTPRETRDHAIDRELLQEAKYKAGIKKRVIAKIVNKEENHDIVIFEGQDPHLCRTTQEEPDIVDVEWFNPKIIFGSAKDPLRVELVSQKLRAKKIELKLELQKSGLEDQELKLELQKLEESFKDSFPVYRRHVNWIQGIFNK